MNRVDRICVGCESPLVRGQRYGVRLGRLWHSSCFLAFEGRTAKERADARRLEAAEARAQSLAVEVETVSRQREDLRLRAVRSERDVTTLQAQIRKLEADRDQARQQLQGARRLAEDLAAESARQQLQGTPGMPLAPPPPPPPATPADATEDKDGSEVRFSLLELD